MYITARRTATEGFIELSRQTPALLHYTKKLFISIRISLRCSGSRPPRRTSAAGRNGHTVALPGSPMSPPPRPPACSTPWRPPLLYLPPLPLQRDAGAALEPAASAACATYPDPAGDGGGVLILPVCFLTPSIPLE